MQTWSGTPAASTPRPKRSRPSMFASAGCPRPSNRPAARSSSADHGNAEMMRDPETGEPHTAHTLNPVPFVVVNPPAEIGHLENGRLSDIAPTLLDILD